MKTIIHSGTGQVAQEEERVERTWFSSDEFVWPYKRRRLLCKFFNDLRLLLLLVPIFCGAFTTQFACVFSPDNVLA